MRVVVAAVLLFFNAAFVLWMAFGNGQRAGHGTVPATDPGIAPLVLLSERPPAGAPEHSGSTARSEPVSGSAGAGGSPGSMQAVPSVQSPAPSAEPPPRQSPFSGRRPEEATAPVQSSVESAPVGDLSQQRAGEHAAGETPPVQPAEMPSATAERPPTEICHVVGPYLDRRAAQATAERLAREEIEALVLEESVIEPRYWVYLPPFVSRSAAFEVERELRAQGVEDLQVLAGEGKENGISLGLYREQAAAARRMRQLRGLGYAPRLDVIERSRPQLWLQLQGIGAVESEPAPWVASLLAADPALELRPCDLESQSR